MNNGDIAGDIHNFPIILEACKLHASGDWKMGSFVTGETIVGTVVGNCGCPVGGNKYGFRVNIRSVVVMI
jgi:hypothetical protein